MGLFDDLIPSGQPTARITVNPVQRAFLNSMSAGESPNYNTMYGGERFEELTDHPRQRVPIRSGPNAGKSSSAAGKYQFLAGTWDEAKNALGLPDFSPDSQDAAAAWLAERDYKNRTGRNLWEDVESAKNDPGKLTKIGGALSGTWTSLPGGIEPNRATSGFGQRFATALQSGGVANAAQAPATQAPTAQPKSGMFDDLIPQTPTAAKPDFGQGNAALMGASQGITANFGDEIVGARAAAGLPENAARSLALTPFVGPLIEPAIGAAKLGYEYLTGGDTATKQYEAARDKYRADAKTAEQQYPKTYMAGNIGGAVAMPVGGALNAATMPARIGRSAAVGATYGAAAGAGEGTGAVDRVSRAIPGAAIGGAVGAVAPPAIAAVEGIGRGIAAAASPITNRIRGAVSPESQAARTVAEAISRDARKGGVELTQPEFAASRAAGQPVAVAELGGERTRAYARWAANVSPEARAIVEKFASERFAGQADRAIEFLQNIAGSSGNTTVIKDSLAGLARIANGPAYRKAYSHPNAQAMWDEGFEQIAQAPVVQNAIRAASVTGANRGTIEGAPRIRSPFVVDKQTGQLTLRIDENGNRVVPNLQFWDHVKRNLDKIATPEARTLNGALKDHLDDLVPSYADARAGAAKFFGAEDALDAGQKFVRANMALGDAQKALSKMSDPDRELFKIGFVSKLIDDIGNTRDRVNVMNQIAATPNAKTKLQMVLGSNGYRQLDALLSVEQSMDRLRTALGNSTSIRQWIEYGLAGGVGGSGLINTDPTQLGIAAAIAGRRYVDDRVAGHIARMLVSDSPDVFAKGIKAVAGNKNLLNAFRDLDVKLSRVGGQQAPSPVMQAAGISRAEDQPEIPRPPGQ
jgi:muramidase (phage lysozyme)